jgi:hypothetical protein
LLVVVLQGLYPKDLALKSNMALVKELEEFDAPQATEPPAAKRLRGPVDPSAVAGQWLPMQGMPPMPMQGWWPQQPWYPPPPPHYGSGSSGSGSGHTWQPHR